MPGGYGSNAFVAICRQNSLGATAPTSWYPVPFARAGIRTVIDELQDDSITGYADEPDRTLGYTRVNGPIEGNVDPLALGFLLKGLFGTIASSAVSSGSSAFQHVYEPRSGDFMPTATLPPYAFQVYQGETGVSSSFLFLDCFVNQLDLSIAPNQYLRGTWGIVGKDSSLITKAAPPAWPSAVKKFNWSAVSVSIAGAGVARYRDLRFSFDNRIGMQDRINASRAPASFFRDGFRSFGRFQGTMDIAVSDWLNRKNETEQAVSIYIAGVTSINSGVNEFLKLDYSRGKIIDIDESIAGPGLVTVTVGWKGEFNVSSLTPVRVTLQNTMGIGIY